MAVSSAFLVDLVAQNERPDETQDELGAAVGDIVIADVDSLDALSLDEVHCNLSVLKLLGRNSWVLVVSAKRLATDDLQQVDQHDSILKILGEVCDVLTSVLQLVVNPSCESILLDIDPVDFGLRHCVFSTARLSDSLQSQSVNV